jgi:ribosome-associated protein
LRNIVKSIDEKKGEDIVVLDVKNISPVTDYIVIASGDVPTHTQAIAEEVLKNNKEKGELPINVEGLADGRWIAIDYGDIMVNIFIPELREYYNLEELWFDAPRVNLEEIIGQR